MVKDCPHLFRFLGFIGSKEEAIQIKEEIANFLKRELKLELSMEKTLITSASDGRVRFLNYEINAGVVNDKQTKNKNGIKVRALNYRIQLRMPKDVLKKMVSKYKRENKPIHRSEIINLSDYDIVMKYNLELRGLYNYYRPTINVYKLNELKYYMKSSLVKTLANKHRCRASKIYKRYINKKTRAIQVIVPRKNKKNLIASFGDIKLKRKKDFILNHQRDIFLTVHQGRTELLERLLADECELCGSNENIEVHHIRKISDLKRKYEGKTNIPKWKEVMITINRKTLITCKNCHSLIHSGNYNGRKLTEV